MKVLIFSDIHSNNYAMESLVQKEKFDEALFLGDIVDYGPNPTETIDIVRSISKHIISGNHDYASAFNKDCMCGQENHDLSVYTRENITLNEIGKEEIDYLRSLPESKEVKLDGFSFNLYHGSPFNHLYGYLYPWNISKESFRNPLGYDEEPSNYLVGHTHYQFMLNYSGNLVVNPGSAGQPRDGNSKPSYALFDGDEGSFKFKRFDYDRKKLRDDLKSKVQDKKQLEKLFRLFVI